MGEESHSLPQVYITLAFISSEDDNCVPLFGTSLNAKVGDFQELNIDINIMEKKIKKPLDVMTLPKQGPWHSR